jgi:hypothetical protein
MFKGSLDGCAWVSLSDGASVVHGIVFIESTW